MQQKSLLAVLLLVAAGLVFGVKTLLTIATLGSVIFVHEFGHYLLMRRNGVDVVEFTIGFGPSLWETTLANGTKFCLKPFLIGGYAKPVMDGPRGLNGASSWARIRIFMAGMFFNACAAFVAYMVLLYATHTAPGYVVALVKPLGLPQFPRYVLSALIQSFGLWLATPAALVMILSDGLGTFLNGTAGPIGIIQMGNHIASGEAQAGVAVAPALWIGMLSYFAMINVALAGFNLIPIPPLDGGRVADIFLRKLFGRYGNTVSKYFNAAGAILILILIVAVIGMDVVRLLTPK